MVDWLVDFFVGWLAGHTEQNRTGQVRTGQFRSGQVKQEFLLHLFYVFLCVARCCVSLGVILHHLTNINQQNAARHNKATRNHISMPPTPRINATILLSISDNFSLQTTRTAEHDTNINKTQHNTIQYETTHPSHQHFLQLLLRITATILLSSSDVCSLHTHDTSSIKPHHLTQRQSRKRSTTQHETTHPSHQHFVQLLPSSLDVDGDLCHLGIKLIFQRLDL